MPSRPPILMSRHFSVPGLAEGLEALYDVRVSPAPGIRVAVAGGGGIDGATIDALPDLELIALCSVGYDAVDMDKLRARGIRLTNTPDVLTDDVADLAIALMLALYRRIPAADAYVRQGDWAAKGPAPLAHRASGRRIGILGLGRIGRAIAARAAPFAAEIVYHSRKPVAGAPWRYAESPEALAAAVDILIVATPGGSATAKLVNRAVLDGLGPDGVIVNIARGSVIDEPALVAALVEGRIAGAGLDVFADEPHVPAELLALENVVLMPHQGSATIETRTAMGQLTLDNVAAYFAGRPLLTPVP